MANSSPPTRATKSDLRDALISTCAAAIRSSSPALCPRESLISFSPSMSHTTRVTGPKRPESIRVMTSVK